MKQIRVLSIQSHVACGYVGNNAATICLQANGFDVDTINTVSFSNHTGYGKWKGRALTCDEFREIVDGLEVNKLLTYDYIITGYVSDGFLLHEIAMFVEKLKTINPSIVYVCDPVIGDQGKYYVPESLIRVYATRLLPLANIITPNHYEAQWLSGIMINSEPDIKTTLLALHKIGPKTVIITSIDSFNTPGKLKCYGSTLVGSDHRIVDCEFEKLSFSFVGTGDTCTALLVASLSVFNDIHESIKATMTTLQEILRKTIEKYNSFKDSQNLHESFKKELALVSCMPSLVFNSQGHHLK